jgi:hypothetical protein
MVLAVCGALVLLALGWLAGLGVTCRRDRKVLGGNAGKDNARFWVESSVVVSCSTS